MNSTALVSILSTGFVVAFFHAAIPTHWLPFVIASRARHWSRPRTIGIAVLAGGGHVLITTLLGVLVVGAGIAVDHWTGEIFPKIAAALLLVFGGYYLVQHFRGKSHSHAFGGHNHSHSSASHDHSVHRHASHGHADHHHADHDHSGHEHASHDHSGHEHASHDHSGHDHSGHEHTGHIHSGHVAALPNTDPAETSDRTVILGLMALLTFSPCEGFLPVYLSGISYGWAGFALLSAVLAVATLLGMVSFTWLTLAGLERFRLGWIEKYEGAFLGTLLCVLAVVVYWLEAR